GGGSGGAGGAVGLRARWVAPRRGVGGAGGAARAVPGAAGARAPAPLRQAGDAAHGTEASARIDAEPGPGVRLLDRSLSHAPAGPLLLSPQLGRAAPDRSRAARGLADDPPARPCGESGDPRPLLRLAAGEGALVRPRSVSAAAGLRRGPGPQALRRGSRPRAGHDAVFRASVMCGCSAPMVRRTHASESRRDPT